MPSRPASQRSPAYSLSISPARPATAVSRRPRQSAANLRLIANADANGHTRIAGNPRQVQANLDKIIPALETLRAEPGNDAPS